MHNQGKTILIGSKWDFKEVYTICSIGALHTKIKLSGKIKCILKIIVINYSTKIEMHSIL